jgi:hypothetical protein
MEQRRKNICIILLFQVFAHRGRILIMCQRPDWLIDWLTDAQSWASWKSHIQGDKKHGQAYFHYPEAQLPSMPMDGEEKWYQDIPIRSSSFCSRPYFVKRVEGWSVKCQLQQGSDCSQLDGESRHFWINLVDPQSWDQVKTHYDIYIYIMGWLVDKLDHI